MFFWLPVCSPKTHGISKFSGLLKSLLSEKTLVSAQGLLVTSTGGQHLWISASVDAKQALLANPSEPNQRHSEAHRGHKCPLAASVSFTMQPRVEWLLVFGKNCSVHVASAGCRASWVQRVWIFPNIWIFAVYLNCRVSWNRTPPTPRIMRAHCIYY